MFDGRDGSFRDKLFHCLLARPRHHGPRSCGAIRTTDLPATQPLLVKIIIHIANGV